MVNAKPQHTLPTEKKLYTHCAEAGWAPGQAQSEQVQKILLPQGFDPWIVQPVASHYTDYAILNLAHYYIIFN